MWKAFRYEFLKDENAKTWVKYFTFTTITLLATVFIINFSVDPYGTRSWIVEKKYKPIGNERSEKYNYIFYKKNINKFNCLILGSSRAMKLVPHENSNLAGCYNFGIHMATNKEKLFILQEWLKYSNPKHVYLDVDFLNFHKDIENPQFNISSKFKSGNRGDYFSITTLGVSVKSLQNALEKKPVIYFESDGSINYYQNDQKIEKSNFDFSKKRYKQHAESTYKTFFIQTPFIYTQDSLNYLREIKDLCEIHHIPLTVFIPPEQIEYTNKIIMNPSLKFYYQEYKRDITNLFGIVYDFSGNYSENQDQTNFYDTWHYRSTLGEKVIERFEGKNHFGTVLISHKMNTSTNNILTEK